jgi:hypothetical protein
MSKTKKQPPTPLTLFKQQARLEDLRRKVGEQEHKLYDMAKECDYRDEMLVVDGVVYKLSTTRRIFDAPVNIEKVGLASDLASLVCS